MSRSNTEVPVQVTGVLDPRAGAPEQDSTDPVEITWANACQVVGTLDHVAGKWSIGILVSVAEGPIRFTELERAVPGISRRILTMNLRRLERDGLLRRTVYPTVPPKVEYTLTDVARELTASLTGLVRWAERHGPTIAAAREVYDREQAGQE
ncbi:helix-turn-helix domain-containing protein [Embleya sp. NBC_00896]|uniref:winged helix-turn-helix transcriptional regulator n=1 Tax=Embleya sp. NBC_00896 TaxID=2975961 RepID=UPI002F91B59F|nr:helix-turn-helix transcriptional regulator [Embleya sp. NBC_00896]